MATKILAWRRKINFWGHRRWAESKKFLLSTDELLFFLYICFVSPLDLLEQTGRKWQGTLQSIFVSIFRQFLFVFKQLSLSGNKVHSRDTKNVVYAYVTQLEVILSVTYILKICFSCLILMENSLSFSTKFGALFRVFLSKPLEKQKQDLFRKKEI